MDEAGLLVELLQPSVVGCVIVGLIWEADVHPMEGWGLGSA